MKTKWLKVVRRRPDLLLVGASLLLVRNDLFPPLGGALALRLDALVLVKDIRKTIGSIVEVEWELKKSGLNYLFMTGLSLAVDPENRYLSGKSVKQNR